MIEVNQIKCEEVAKIFRGRTIPSDREEIEFLGFTQDETANLLFLIVGICHQTSPREKPALSGYVGDAHLKGWDFLLQRFVECSRTNKELLDSNEWDKFTASKVTEIWGENLTNPSFRAKLINDLGDGLANRGWRTANKIHASCDGQIAGKDKSILKTLATFKAYRDPVQKKSFFLLSLMRNTSIWNYQDHENLGAPVDYHEVRGHLRLGTVEVTDDNLRRKLLNHDIVTPVEDVAIRRSVLDAIMYISNQSLIRDPSGFHYLYWNIFRNYCSVNEPNCDGQREEKYLPDRYKTLAVVREGLAACPFSKVCSSFCIDNKYTEHVFETDFY